MTSERFDVVVIGSGPGGESAALECAARGLSVAVVERFFEVGGGSTHWGAIPSKALRHAVARLGRSTASFPELLASARAAVAEHAKRKRTALLRSGLTILSGTASFISSDEIDVTDAGGARRRLIAGAVVVATGARPWRPSDIDFTDPRILDSGKILRLEETPRRIVIYGGGVVACEYASLLRSLGCEVELIDTRERLLTFVDGELASALTAHLRTQGVRLRHDESYERVESRAGGVLLTLRSGRRVQADYLLWASGRIGNSNGFGLERLGVGVDDRGFVRVDDAQRTGVPGIYAVGDVVGRPNLVSSAREQGRAAAVHITEGFAGPPRRVPTVVFTTPEIGSFGPTEDELAKANIPYNCGRVDYRDVARAQIEGSRIGMLKLLFRPDTLELLAVHCFGPDAVELVHVGQAVMAHGGSLEYFVDATFSHPSMAEAYRAAALDGIARTRRAVKSSSAS